MSFSSWIDGVSVWSADDAAAMQEQTVTRFATTAARDVAIPSPSIGQLTGIAARSSIERWSGATWKIVWSHPQRYALSATPPVTTDASLSTLLTSVGTMVASATYRVTGLVRVTGGTCKLTSVGALTGVWGNAVDGSDAAAFDKTSADASVTLAQGLNPIVGELTASTSGMWDIYSYYGVSAVIDAVSFVQVERIA